MRHGTCEFLHLSINLITVFIFVFFCKMWVNLYIIYAASSLDGFLASFGFYPVEECINLWVKHRSIGYISSDHRIFGVIRLSNMCLNGHIILSAKNGCVFICNLCYMIFIQIFRNNTLFLIVVSPSVWTILGGGPSYSCTEWNLRLIRLQCLTLTELYHSIS